MSLPCQWQVHRLCFGKDLFTYVYIDIYSIFVLGLSRFEKQLFIYIYIYIYTLLWKHSITVSTHYLVPSLRRVLGNGWLLELYVLTTSNCRFGHIYIWPSVRWNLCSLKYPFREMSVWRKVCSETYLFVEMFAQWNMLVKYPWTIT